MAELCLGLATSHLAHIVNARDAGDPAKVAAFDAGYARLAAALREAAPDACLIVSAEHVNKFFIDNMPAFCMGLFESFSGPVESKARDVGYPWREVPSDPGLARYLIERGLDEGVDWAVSEFWEVDHGMMVPLHKLDPEGRVPMIPVFVNCASAPMPSARRCFAVGRWLADAIADWPASKRVGIVATGGLSHSVGTLDPRPHRCRIRRMVPRPAVRRRWSGARRAGRCRDDGSRQFDGRSPVVDRPRGRLRRAPRGTRVLRAHRGLRYRLRAGGLPLRRRSVGDQGTGFAAELDADGIAGGEAASAPIRTRAKQDVAQSDEIDHRVAQELYRVDHTGPGIVDSGFGARNHLHAFGPERGRNAVARLERHPAHSIEAGAPDSLRTEPVQVGLPVVDRAHPGLDQVGGAEKRATNRVRG